MDDVKNYETGLRKLGLGEPSWPRGIPLDIRLPANAAFAWRVLEALPYSEWWRLVHSPDCTKVTLAEDLYAAVCELGREP